MKPKQNIATPLLLLLWAVMFCFAVLFTVNKPVPQAYTLPATAFQHQEKLTQEHQRSPLAWTEPSASKTIAEQSQSSLQVYNPLSWLCNTADFSIFAKSGKSIYAFAVTTIRHQVHPNAP